MIRNSAETIAFLAMDAEEKLKTTMGEINDDAEKNVSLDPLEKRLKGKENKKLDEPDKEPEDLSKVTESVQVKGGGAVEYILQSVPVFNEILHDKFYASGIPITFIREGKTFSGVFLFGTSYHLLVEFTADGENDKITGLSKFAYEMVSEQAEWTMLFDAPTLEENLENAALLLTDSHPLEEKVLEESKKSDVQEFLATADLDQSVSSLYRDYFQWAKQKGKAETSEPHFRSVVKQMKMKGSSDSDTSTPTIKHFQDTFETPVEYDEFEKEILENDVFYKYEMMGELVKKIVQKDPLYKNVFIYGVGGIGKTFTVEQVVDKYAKPGDVVTYKGAISGFTGLLQVLWENRDGKIIIFDDNDGILTGNQQNAANLLKGAMEMSDPRILSYSRFKRKKEFIEPDEMVVEEEPIIHDEENSEEDLFDKDYNEFLSYDYAEAVLPLNTLLDVSSLREQFEDEDEDEDEALESDELDSMNYEQTDFDKQEFLKNYKGELDPENDPAFGLGPDDPVPDKFQFNSRIIFISNLMSVPQPLFDRTYSVGLLLTKEQILDLIDSKLSELMRDQPQITLEDKKETLKFMRKYLHRAGKTPTFRGFQQLIALYKSDHPDKMKLMYLTYTNSGMKTSLK